MSIAPLTLADGLVTCPMEVGVVIAAVLHLAHVHTSRHKTTHADTSPS